MSLPASEAIADHLLAEIARREDRPYEEIGVPTFFVAEDLTAGAAPPRAVGIAPDPLGVHFAQLSRALVSRKPELETSDIGKLMEVFSEHHFPAFGTETAHRPSIYDEDDGADVALPAETRAVLWTIADGIARGRAIRAVNFHATPRYREAEFRQQIAAYARDFEPVTPANLDAAIAGDWPHARPGLIPMLFEGFRDNLDVMLPILEEHGFTGWFFVPSSFLAIPADEQRVFAAAHDLDPALQDEYPGERIALTWDEAREIRRRGHVFACHSRTHNEVTADTPPEVLEDEIVVAKAEMEGHLGHPVDIFCWLGGAEVGVNPEADRMLGAAGFRYLFSNFKIQKLS